MRFLESFDRDWAAPRTAKQTSKASPEAGQTAGGVRKEESCDLEDGDDSANGSVDRMCRDS
jgi:hypothetical protein